MKSITKLGLIALIASQCGALYPADSNSSWWPKINFREPNHTKKTFFYPYFAMTTISITSSLASLAACLKGDKGKQDKMFKLGLIIGLPASAVGLYFGKKEKTLNRLHLQLQEALHEVRPHAEIKVILEQIPAIHPSYHHCLALLIANYENEMELWPLVKMMLERGVSPNVRVQYGPIAHPVVGNTALGSALRKGYLQIAKLLLNAGAHADQEFAIIITGLYEPGPEQYKMAELLLDHGVDIGKTFFGGQTILQKAIAYSLDNPDLINLLFEYGAISMLNTCDNHGNTPLLIAAKEGCINCMCLLLKHGADTDIKNIAGESLESIALKWDHPSVENPVRRALASYSQEIHHAARHGLTGEDAKKFDRKSAAYRAKIMTAPGFEPGNATGGLNALIADYIGGPEQTDADEKLAAEAIAEIMTTQAENGRQAEAHNRWDNLEISSQNKNLSTRTI